MLSPNFQNTPIEYKQINEDDFDAEIYKVEPKIIIEPDNEGYLSSALSPILTSDKERINTTIINAGVGQGKTTAILKTITEFAEQDDYIVIIAVPFKTLIEQYHKDCINNGISERKIFSLLELDNFFIKSENTEKRTWGYTDDEEWLDNHNKKFNITNYSIHILTVNALLGNSGESLFQSSKRTQYFNHLINYSKKTNKKLVFLFDEIHASIHNFEERFIYKLWNYQNLVHKIYVVSATFNEASKEVIKYLSEFTDNRIKIIESKRISKPNQSDLFLHFYKDRNINKDKGLFKLVKRLIDKDKEFDVLVYSKDLANTLYTDKDKNELSKKSMVNQLLSLKKDKLNKCFTDLYKPEETKRYNPKMINIGTNFSTGINIEKENHTLIILFPKDLTIKYLNNKGVFTSGTNTIIQAIARQRKQGEIHLFLPNPIMIDDKSLPKNYSEQQKSEIINTFNTYKKYTIDDNEKVLYSDINSQNIELTNMYNRLHNEVETAIEHVENVKRNENLNRLLYPTKDIFILSHGENQLTKNFFNGNLSAYVLWASITNQFLNCKLTKIFSENILFFNKESLYNDIIDTVRLDISTLQKMFWNFNLYESFSGIEKINVFNNNILSNKIIISGKKATIPERDKILLVILNTIIYNSEIFNLKEDKKKLYYYYLRSSVFHSSNITDEQVDKNLSKNLIHLIHIYKKWQKFIDLLDKSIETHKNKNRLTVNSTAEFTQLYLELNFKEDIIYLLQNDNFLGTDIFPFKNTINKTLKIETNTIQAFYKILVASFYHSKRKQTSKNGKKTYYYEVKKINNKKLENFLFNTIIEEVL